MAREAFLLGWGARGGIGALMLPAGLCGGPAALSEPLFPPGIEVHIAFLCLSLKE